MSLVVAVKDKDRFVFGADKQITYGSNKTHDGIKIWEVEELPGAIMGSVGTLRALQILQHTQLFDRNLLVDGEMNVDTDFVFANLIPQIIQAFKDNGIYFAEAEDVTIPNVILFAYKDKAWLIYNDLSITEIEDYYAIGSGSDVANGALYATQGEDAFDRIVLSIGAAMYNTLYVDGNIEFVATKYYDSDEQWAKEHNEEGELEGLDTENVEAVETAETTEPQKKPRKKA